VTTVVSADGTLAEILTTANLRRLMEKHGGAVWDMKLADCMPASPDHRAQLLASEL